MPNITKWYAVYRCRRCHEEFKREISDEQASNSLDMPNQTTTHVCGYYTGFADIIGHDKETTYVEPR
jgi:DNA-directed RNA polymerase subunit RPC12/RpoP